MKKLLLILTLLVIGQIKADAFLDAYSKITDPNLKNLVAQFLYYSIYDMQATGSNISGQVYKTLLRAGPESAETYQVLQAISAAHGEAPQQEQLHDTVLKKFIDLYTTAYAGLDSNNRKITFRPDAGKLLVAPTSDFQSQRCQLYSTDFSKICPKVSA